MFQPVVRNTGKPMFQPVVRNTGKPMFQPVVKHSNLRTTNLLAPVTKNIVEGVKIAPTEICAEKWVIMLPLKSLATINSTLHLAEVVVAEIVTCIMVVMI
jgi:hypothetical protein